MISLDRQILFYRKTNLKKFAWNIPIGETIGVILAIMYIYLFLLFLHPVSYLKTTFLGLPKKVFKTTKVVLI